MTDQEASSSQGLREEFVENAKRFFKNPKIRSTPLDEQKKFLLSKGVTQAEIDAALNTIPTADLAANQDALPIYQTHIPPPPPPTNPIMTAAQSAVIIAGATYMAYKFVRSWLLPKFFDIADPAEEERRELHTQLNELQDTTKTVMESVTHCTETISAQQDQLNRALTLISTNNKGNNNLDRLQTDIAVIKSLLLRGDQFPLVPIPNEANSNGLVQTRSTPRLNGQSTEIPAWQLNNKESTESDSSTILENTEPEDHSTSSLNEA